MKKALSLLLVLVMCLSLCACGECKHKQWHNATCLSAKTCANCGAQEGEPLNHNWKRATCTTPKVCSACGTQEGNALGHNWAAATCLKAKSCTRCLKTEGSKLGHLYSGGVCLMCGGDDPKYTQLVWSDIFKDQPEVYMDRNSVGGMELEWSHTYTGGKTVNYITMTFTLLDRVGNPVRDDIHGKSTHSVKIVGPWSGNVLEYYGGEVWAYCRACNAIRIDSIILEYADGTFAKCQYGWVFSFQ